MTVRGFTIDPEDRNKRLPTTYPSKEERAWCECVELTDAEFYEEANKKFQEYIEHRSSSGSSGSPGPLLLARINLGIAKSGKGDTDKAFGVAIEQIIQAVGNDDGGSVDEITKLMEELIEERTTRLVPLDESLSPPSCDYEKASSQNLVTVAEMFVKLFESVYEGIEYEMICADISEALLFILEVLWDRNRKATVMSLAGRLLRLESNVGRLPLPGDNGSVTEALVFSTF